VGQLRAEQAHWEGVRQTACAQLLDHANREPAAGPETSFYTDNEAEQLRSQAAAAMFHLQEVARRLADVRELLEADALEAAADAHDPERERMELVKRDDALKEQLVADAAQKAESLSKEEQQKAAALEKEQRDKEFFDKKDADRLEALAKDEEQKQESIAKAERDKQEAQQQAQPSDLELLASINEEWEYVQAQIAEEWEYIQGEIAKELEYVVDEIGKEWDYVDKEIEKEMEYNVSQTIDAVSEAVLEITLALKNNVSQKEGKEFVEARKEALADFVADEVFQGAPAEHKELWLKDKFQEQWRAEQAAFADRNDDFGMRKVVQEGLAELQDSLMKAVAAERKLEDQVNAVVAERDKNEAATQARLEQKGLDPDVLEEKLKQLQEIGKAQEQQARDAAEKEREQLWAKAQVELRAIEAVRRAEAEQLEADKRREFDLARQDVARTL
jgi:hypothetical protein